MCVDEVGILAPIDGWSEKVLCLFLNLRMKLNYGRILVPAKEIQYRTVLLVMKQGDMYSPVDSFHVVAAVVVPPPPPTHRGLHVS